MNCSDTSFDAIDCTVTQGRMSDNKYYEVRKTPFQHLLKVLTIMPSIL